MNTKATDSVELTQKDLAYNEISETWESFVSQYDTHRRVDVLVNEFLGEKEIKDKETLDVGCGLGFFSQAIFHHKPKTHNACDLAPKLVQRLSQKNKDIHCFVANILELPQTLKGKKFDVVVCSEVIEHTPDPKLAIKQVAEAVAEGGLLSISTPNKMWRWLLTLAHVLRLRDNYQGHENWVSPKEFKECVLKEGFEILHCEGIHTIPYKLFPKKLLLKLDQRLRKSNYSYAFNLALLARKK